MPVAGPSPQLPRRQGHSRSPGSSVDPLTGHRGLVWAPIPGYPALPRLSQLDHIGDGDGTVRPDPERPAQAGRKAAGEVRHRRLLPALEPLRDGRASGV